MMMIIGMRGSSSQSNNAILSSLLTTAQSRASSLMAKATSFFTKFTPYYVTRIVDNLAEGRACPEDETFNIFDPRSRDGTVASKVNITLIFPIVVNIIIALYIIAILLCIAAEIQ